MRLSEPVIDIFSKYFLGDLRTKMKKLIHRLDSHRLDLYSIKMLELYLILYLIFAAVAKVAEIELYKLSLLL